MNFLKVARQAIVNILHPKLYYRFEFLPNTKVDYEAKVQDALGSNVVMTPVQWIGRVFPEARVAIATEKKPGQVEYDQAHELARLLQNPNPFNSGSALWMASVISWCTNGNVYLLKGKNRAGQVKQLWYVPHWMVTPKWEGNDFITYYEYRPFGVETQKLKPEDIVHLKNGINPRNVRLGYSPLYAILREVFNDDEAANFAAGLLANSGVPGVIISPKDSAGASPSALQETKEYIREMFTGDRRGEPLALGGPTEIQQFGFNPQQMDLSAIRDVSEERVCAALGVPAAIVGFGAGLQQTKVGATMQELSKLAWSAGIIPMQEAMADELTRNLRDDFRLADNQRVGWDRSNVSALQDDKNQQAERIARAVSGGWMTVAEARRLTGLEVAPEHEVFLRPFNAIESGPGADQSPEPSSQAAKKARTSVMLKRLDKRQGKILQAMDKMRGKMEKRIEKKLSEFFKMFADEVESAYRAMPKTAEDEARVEVLQSRIGYQKLKGELRGIMGSHYVSVYNETQKIFADLGLGVDLPSSVELEVLSLGGSRAGLVDLSQVAKERALDILRDARERGLGADDTARLLRDSLPAGPWSSSSVRSQVVARTETRVAQTTAALQTYRAVEGVEQVMVIDARLGATDQDCEEINGEVVDFDEARRLLAEEHPNGTRDIVPVFGGA